MAVCRSPGVYCLLDSCDIGRDIVLAGGRVDGNNLLDRCEARGQIGIMDEFIPIEEAILPTGIGAEAMIARGMVRHTTDIAQRVCHRGDPGGPQRTLLQKEGQGEDGVNANLHSIVIEYTPP